MSKKHTNLKPIFDLNNTTLNGLNYGNALQVNSLKDSDVIQENASVILKQTEKKDAMVCEELPIDAPVEKQDSGLQLTLDDIDSPSRGNKSKKSVSFSDHSNILYFNETRATRQISELQPEICFNFFYSSEEDRKQADVACPEFNLDTKYPINKDLVVTLERLPLSLINEIEKKQYIPKECSKTAENIGIVSRPVNVLENDLSSTDSALKEDIYPLSKLTVSLHRLPDNLLEMHRSTLNAQNSTQIAHSEISNSSFHNIENPIKDNDINYDLLSWTNANILSKSTSELNNSTTTKEKLLDSGLLEENSNDLLTGKENCNSQEYSDIATKKVFVKLEKLNFALPRVGTEQVAHSLEENPPEKTPHVRDCAMPINNFSHLKLTHLAEIHNSDSLTLLANVNKMEKNSACEKKQKPSTTRTSSTMEDSSSEDDLPLSYFAKCENLHKSSGETPLKQKVQNKSFENENHDSTVPINNFINLKLSHLVELNHTDPFTLLTKVNKMYKSFAMKQKQKTRTKSNKKTSLSHLTKIKYINLPNLHTNITNEVQNTNSNECSLPILENDALHHSFYVSSQPQTSDKDTVLLVSPRNEITIDHLPCHVYEYSNRASASQMEIGSETQSQANAAVSRATISTKTFKKKKKKKLDNPKVFLETYIKKFCSDFDKNENSGTRSSANKEKSIKNSARKRQENAYKIILSNLHKHIKKTCRVKKAYKRNHRKINSIKNLSKKSPTQLQADSKNNSVQLANADSIVQIDISQDESNAENTPLLKKSPKLKPKVQFSDKSLKIRKFEKSKLKKKHTNKYEMGFVADNTSLRLYNKCLARELLILSKYKMRKEQKKKLKGLFKSLKENALNIGKS